MLTRRDVLKLSLVAGAAGLAAAAACTLPHGSSTATRSPAPPSPSPSPTPVTPWPEADAILAGTAVPSFPAANFVVTDARYGAVAYSGADSTAAFAAAIADCNAAGGGHVIVPSGAYTTGAIRLLSNVDLHFEAGATLNFSGDPRKYPPVFTRYAGIECVNYSPMIYAFRETNIAVTGPGVLDADATASWNVGADFQGVLEPLVARGIPAEQRVLPKFGRLRSAFVEPYACTGVLLQGFTLRRSQFWQLHPTLCRNVWIEDVTTGGTSAVNSDGCDPESCDHVVLTNCTFDAADDCIAIKSGRDDDGRRVNAPCQNIVIRGCRVQGPVGGIAFGSEMTGGIRNVFVYDTQTYGTGVRYMFYVKSNTRRGGFAQHIRFDKVRADRSSGAWALAQMDYAGQTGQYLPVFGDWHLASVNGDSMPVAFHLSGLPGDPIHDLQVRDSTFTNVSSPTDFYSNVEPPSFQNVAINGSTASQ